LRLLTIRLILRTLLLSLLLDPKLHCDSDQSQTATGALRLALKAIVQSTEAVHLRVHTADPRLRNNLLQRQTRAPYRQHPQSPKWHPRYLPSC
jgi:hypothetical protein